MSSPCHIELVLSEKDSTVPAAVVRKHLFCYHSVVHEAVTMQSFYDEGYMQGHCEFYMAVTRLAAVFQEETKERKLSKREAAKKLRSGTKSAAVV